MNKDLNLLNENSLNRMKVLNTNPIQIRKMVVKKVKKRKTQLKLIWRKKTASILVLSINRLSIWLKNSKLQEMMKREKDDQQNLKMTKKIQWEIIRRATEEMLHLKYFNS